MPYSDCKITGPYILPGGRRVMAIAYPDGSKSRVPMLDTM